MSPEQVSGQPTDGRSDIFSLGALFFELLTGERPFHADGIITLLNTIATKPHRPVREVNERVPEYLGKVVNKALTKAPDKRFQRADEMARALRAFLAKVDQIAAAKSGAATKKGT
jgi:serine/threonine-protein kinase